MCEISQEPKEVHLTTVKSIFKNVIETSNLCLWFKRRKDLRLISFCDTDYAEDKVERKNTSGSCHFIGRNLVTWICKKQGLTVLSTVEA